MSKKTLRSVYLDLEQAKRLKLLSARTRVPQAVYIREGLDLVMNRYERKIKRSLSTDPAIKNGQVRILTLLKR